MNDTEKIQMLREALEAFARQAGHPRSHSLGCLCCGISGDGTTCESRHAKATAALAATQDAGAQCTAATCAGQNCPSCRAGYAREQDLLAFGERAWKAGYARGCVAERGENESFGCSIDLATLLREKP